MRSRKVTQSTSKNQTPTLPPHKPTPWCDGSGCSNDSAMPANGTETPQDGFSGSEAPNALSPASDAAEVIITKNSGFWCTMFGSHKSRILDEDKQPFPDRDDPVMVAKYLASKANGPINVIWW